MNILGISAHYHDSAAALVVDGVPVASVQEERLSRRKNDSSFPLAAIEWCLAHANLEPEALDAIVFYERPMLKFERILTCSLRAFPHLWRSFPTAMKNALGEKVWVRGIIASQLGVAPNKVLFTEHHQSHAAVSLLTAPTERAAILISDGVGEWATVSAGVGERKRGGPASIRLEREVRFPHSLGMLYSTFTAFLGFAVNEGEYKVMGLAAYGKPAMADAVRRVVRRTGDGAFALDLDYFDYHTTGRRSYSHRFVEVFGAPRSPYDPIDLATEDGRRFADLAASIQLVLEELLLDLACALQRQTGMSDLCLGGGVALNGVANARLLAESGFERIFVPPAPGDAGCALGAALYADRIHFGNADCEVPEHPFWGPVVNAEDLARLAREDGLPVERLEDAALFGATAKDLREGRIVGWMEGAMELGPRALGHRSILAAPHDTAMRDRLNRDIKYREEFRPFAPIVPAADAAAYFEFPANGGGPRLARFMSGVFPVRAEFRERLGAVTHVDGSARVQGAGTVDGAAHARPAARVRRAGERRGAGPSQHLVEPVGRTDREYGGRGLFQLSPQRHGRAGSAAVPCQEAGRAEHEERGMIAKKSRMRRQLIILRTTFGSIADLTRGMWNSESGRRWMVPLAIFLCVTGSVLVLAASVEVFAPFIYTLF